jgi:hypothetical protein
MLPMLRLIDCKMLFELFLYCLSMNCISVISDCLNTSSVATLIGFLTKFVMLICIKTGSPREFSVFLYCNMRKDAKASGCFSILSFSQTEFINIWLLKFK